MKSINDLSNFDFIEHTVPNHREINKEIAKHLDIIVKEIKSNLHFVKSVYLTGGYSRGEGTVLNTKNKFKFISDYDILVETHYLKLYNLLKSKKLERKLSEKLNSLVEINVLVRKPSKRILFYEMIQEGLCIHGQDNLSKFRFPSNQIDKYDGLRLLFNRMQGLVVAVYKEFPRATYSEYWNDKIIKESMKGFLAIAESLLLLSDKYLPTYKERNKVFQDIFKKDFFELYVQMVDLEYFVDLATKWKLNPNTISVSNPVDLWFKARDYMLKIVDYYIKRLYKIEDNENPIDVFLKERKYCEIWTNFKYIFLKFLNENQMMPEVIWAIPPLTLRLKAALYYTLESIYKNGWIDGHKLNKAYDFLRPLTINANCRKNLDITDWKTMVEFLKNNYSLA
jgi:predicted nucleotidyltransferase